MAARRGSPAAAGSSLAYALIQGGGKPRPYYTRAWQADSSYSRGDPCGRPGMGAMLQSALSPRLWGLLLHRLLHISRR